MQTRLRQHAMHESAGRSRECARIVEQQHCCEQLRDGCQQVLERHILVEFTVLELGYEHKVRARLKSHRPQQREITHVRGVIPLTQAKPALSTELLALNPKTATIAPPGYQRSDSQEAPIQTQGLHQPVPIVPWRKLEK
jgi:hypothetical protein